MERFGTLERPHTCRGPCTLERFPYPGGGGGEGRGFSTLERSLHPAEVQHHGEVPCPAERRTPWRGSAPRRGPAAGSLLWLAPCRGTIQLPLLNLTFQALSGPACHPQLHNIWPLPKSTWNVPDTLSFPWNTPLLSSVYGSPMYSTEQDANTISFVKPLFEFILGLFAPFQTEFPKEVSRIHVFSPHSTWQPST